MKQEPEQPIPYTYHCCHKLEQVLESQPVKQTHSRHSDYYELIASVDTITDFVPYS